MTIILTYYGVSEKITYACRGDSVLIVSAHRDVPCFYSLYWSIREWAVTRRRGFMLVLAAGTTAKVNTIGGLLSSQTSSITEQRWRSCLNFFVTKRLNRRAGRSWYFGVF